MDDSGGNLATTPTVDSAAAGDGTSMASQPNAPATGPAGTATPSTGAAPALVSANTSPAAAAPAAAAPSWFSQAGNAVGDVFNSGGLSTLSKGISPLLAAGGAANAIIGGMGKTPQSGAITNIASQQAATAQPLIAAGTALTNETANGQLPSAVQSELDQQLQQQINQIHAQYAQMGLSGSTMEQQAIQNAQNQYQSQVASQLQSFMQQGVNDISQGNSDLSNAGGTYQNLANTQLQQQQGMSTAIANLLKAFSGGGGNSTSIGG